MDLIEKMRLMALVLEKEWGTRPRFVLALSGGADEHWQIFNPKDMPGSDGPMPRYVISNILSDQDFLDKDGRPENHVEIHPG